MSDERSAALIAGGLPDAGLPSAGERPALVMHAQGLARERGARVVAWPRWGAAVITPAAPPLGLVAGGLGLLLPPDDLVLAPEQAAECTRALAALLDRPSPEAAAAAQAALAPLETVAAELWRVVIAGWAAALAREWEQLEAALTQAAALVARPGLARAELAYAQFALAVLALEAGEAADAAGKRAAAAAEIFGQLGLEPQAALASWTQAQALERQGDEDGARRVAGQALLRFDMAAAPGVAALLLAGLANMRLLGNSDAAERDAAAAQLAEAAERCPADTNPLLAARLHTSLGDLIQAHAHDAASLQRALACYERAATLFARHGTPEDLAAVQMNQGSAWQGMGGDLRGTLLKAINYYHQALRVFTLAAHPGEYALIHNNLAAAYQRLPMGGEQDVMRQALAVQSMQEALKVYTLEEFPREYAMVQNNLGNAYQYMPSGDRVDKLDRAIEAYHEALRVRSRSRAPVEYAVTMSNLANAYANVPAEERQQMLGLAERCYGEAHEIFSEHQLADHAATVEQALAQVRRDLGQHAVR